MADAPRPEDQRVWNAASPFAQALFLYAAALVGAGVATQAMAPPGVPARDEYVVPGAAAAVLAILAIVTLQYPRARGLALGAMRLGLAVPLVCAAAYAVRAWDTNDALRRSHACEAEYAAAVVAGSVPMGDEAERARFFEARGAPDHDVAYRRDAALLVALGSVAAFGYLMARRVRPDPRSRG